MLSGFDGYHAASGDGLRFALRVRHFRQSFKNGWQQESADNWLRDGDPWEICRLHEKVEIKLNCSFKLRDGKVEVFRIGPPACPEFPLIVQWLGTEERQSTLSASGPPMPRTILTSKNSATGDFVGALAGTLEAESLTRVLYPDDSTMRGQELRFVQEYFLVACSLADLIRRFLRHNTDWEQLPENVAIQLNDTHPSMSVPELMRILLDDAHLGWDQAWDLTRKTLAYTNHTLLPEALEKWPVAWFEILLRAIWRSSLRSIAGCSTMVRVRFPGDEGRMERISLVEERPSRKIRMANLAIVGSHSTNGVAAIHSRLLRTTTVKDLADMFPERFNNKTNGVTPRRWLLLANPALAGAITEAIGEAGSPILSKLQKSKPLANDRLFCEAFLIAKREAKVPFADWLKATSGQIVDPDTIFDCQIKRIHEYKRQLLNALRIVVLYNRLRENPNLNMPSRTFFFAGKAAPAYRLAKVIIKFINNLAGVIDGDPAVHSVQSCFPSRIRRLSGRTTDSCERCLQPDFDGGIRSQRHKQHEIHDERSSTLGTRDGATIEMAEEAGKENLFLFGLTVEQVETASPGMTRIGTMITNRDRSGSGPYRFRPFQP